VELINSPESARRHSGRGGLRYAGKGWVPADTASNIGAGVIAILAAIWSWKTNTPARPSITRRLRRHRSSRETFTANKRDRPCASTSLAAFALALRARRLHTR